MAEFTVELHGEVRELYAVTAETEEEARENWMDGHMYLSESSSMEIYSVTEDES
jgi:hypothetical protein